MLRVLFTFPLEYFADVSLTVQNADHTEHIILHDVVDLHLLETLNRPSAQPGEDRITELFRRSHFRHPTDGFNGAIHRIDKCVRRIEGSLQQVVSELADDIVLCRRPDDSFTNVASGLGVFWRGPRLRP